MASHHRFNGVPRGYEVTVNPCACDDLRIPLEHLYNAVSQSAGVCRRDNGTEISDLLTRCPNVRRNDRTTDHDRLSYDTGKCLECIGRGGENECVTISVLLGKPRGWHPAEEDHRAQPERPCSRSHCLQLDIHMIDEAKFNVVLRLERSECVKQVKDSFLSDQLSYVQQPPSARSGRVRGYVREKRALDAVPYNPLRLWGYPELAALHCCFRFRQRDNGVCAGEDIAQYHRPERRPLKPSVSREHHRRRIRRRGSPYGTKAEMVRMDNVEASQRLAR